MLRLIAMSEDLIHEGCFTIAREGNDFALFSRRRDILLVTAGRYGLSIDKLDMEEHTAVVTQVIYSNQSLIHVRRQQDFLGERNVITGSWIYLPKVLEIFKSPQSIGKFKAAFLVVENHGEKDSTVAFYEHKGTMGFQLKRRVQVDINAKE